MENTTNFKEGDKVKNHDNHKFEQPYSRAVVTDTEPEQGDIEIMPLEGKAKGETVTKEKDDIAELKQKIWLCMVGRSYGTSGNKAIAVRNALQHYNVKPENREEPVKIWLAEVDKTNWEIYGMGNIRSTFIDNEEEAEIKPEIAEEIGNRAEDTTRLVHSALDGTEPYREGFNYESVTTTGY